ncbi:trimeric intracellular cation channel family protein [Halocatena halophila]|uniref:trimeric intracellular cation channel family protein n=1 Tax=Halocatena halophila TaxID=2814576 RepID=UPI002ED454DD
MILNPVFEVVNAIGLVAFALVGASKAVREEFDLFGVLIVGLLTAFGGGTTRDLLVDRMPLVLQTHWNVLFGVSGVVLAIGLLYAIDVPDEHHITVGADAAGLAAFATTGAIVASEAGVSAFGVVTIATINAVGGGVLADICLDRQPFILFQDFYASCAVLGGISFWIVSGFTASTTVPAAVCAGTTVFVRFVAIGRNWRLPAVSGLVVD